MQNVTLQFFDFSCAELKGNLQEIVNATRKQLHETFNFKSTENNAKLTDIRDKKKQIEKYEKTLLSFAKKLSNNQENAISKLEKYENVSAYASVHELTNTISKTLLLLDESPNEPNIPKFVVPHCEESADDVHSAEVLDQNFY